MLTKFTTWASGVIRTICDRPDHLQRLSIAGAGVSIWPLIVWLIGIISNTKKWASTEQAHQLTILGNLSLGLLALLALVIIALLGIIRGLKASLPGGASIDVDIVDPHDRGTQ